MHIEYHCFLSVRTLACSLLVYINDSSCLSLFMENSSSQRNHLSGVISLFADCIMLLILSRHILQLFPAFPIPDCSLWRRWYVWCYRRFIPCKPADVVNMFSTHNTKRKNYLLRSKQRLKNMQRLYRLFLCQSQLLYSHTVRGNKRCMCMHALFNLIVFIII